MRLIHWLQHPLHAAWLAVAAIMIMGAVGPLSDAPRQDRVWFPYLARVPDVTIAGDHFSVTPVSDWSYDSARKTEQRFIEAGYDISSVRNIWFMLEPQPGSQLAAHTLLIFEFPGDRLLGVTIEARLEADEGYDALAGVFNAYELSYHWATARDLLVRRAVMLGHEVFVYPTEIDAHEKQLLLRNLLERTESLETQPRFYNTITSNCTNELAKAAGMSWTPEYVLTGRSDEWLFRNHLLPGRNFEDAHARSDMTQFIRALNHIPAAEFDRELLGELRRRFGAADFSAPTGPA